jgi:hypothetical protein
MPFTIKISTVDSGDIEIQTVANIKSSEFINGYITDTGFNGDYIDLTCMSRHELTEQQARRFYAIWDFLCGSEEGAKYLEMADRDYWQYRNFRVEKCLDAQLVSILKATPTEYEEIKKDLVFATTVSYDDLETNEHTKAFLDNGFISLKQIICLANYADFLSIRPVLNVLCGVIAGHLKRLTKVLPTPPPDNGTQMEIESGVVEENVISMQLTTQTNQQTSSCMKSSAVTTI